MPTLIPSVINVTASGVGIISNDPLAAFDSIVLPFDTNLADITNNRYVGTAANGVAVTATNPKFGAGSLNLPATVTATSAYAAVPIAQGGPLDILSGTTDFCVDFWVRPTSATAVLLITYGDNPSAGTDPSSLTHIVFQFSSTQTRVASGILSPGGGTWQVLTGAAPVINTWTHIALTRQGGIPQLYVGGVRAATNSSPWAGYVFPTLYSPFIVFGLDSSTSGSLMTGQVDEFRVTKGNCRYTGNFTPPTVATIFFPISQGYSNGFTDGVPFGSVNPNPALIDGDIVATTSVFNSGTLTAPVYNFQVVVEGQMLKGDLVGVTFTDAFGQAQSFTGASATFTLDANSTYGKWSWPTTGYLLPTGTVTPVTMTFEDPNVEFNCYCDIVSPYKTLAAVRQKMLIRLGYPNQLTNPPPGMATLVDQFLRDAQDQIYRQLQRAALWTERFYHWTMVPGQRYYGLTDNEGVCAINVDPYKITWVGFEDLNKAWYKLDEGIPPEYYTRANINFGWPTRFEVRSCIEIFPAPQAAYTLWVKGDFPPAALVADTDVFTIDDVACFLLALGNAKAHYGQKDAQLVLTQAGNYTKSLVAGTHGTKRYVPRSETESPLTPPKFLPLGNSQA